MGIGIAQTALQQIPVQEIAVLTYLSLAPGAKQSEVAENCGVVPAITLTLKALQQTFDRCANATASIGLDKSQQLLLGLAQAGCIIAKQSVLPLAQVFANVSLAEPHIPQHTQVRIGAFDELVETFQNSCLTIGTGGFDIGSIDDQLSTCQQVL